MKMSKKFVIGVDLGTSGTKAALYQMDGKLISDASVEVPLFYPKPGVVEQENEDFYTSAAKTIRSCIESSGIEPKAIAAIAFDSQMAGVGLIDDDFNPVARFDSWLDMRCQPYIEWMDKEAGDRITQLTGCPPTVIMVQRCWVEERATRHLSADSKVCDAGNLCRWQNSRFKSGSGIYRSYLHPFFRLF
jgi:xylulokinase